MGAYGYVGVDVGMCGCEGNQDLGIVFQLPQETHLQTSVNEV